MSDRSAFPWGLPLAAGAVAGVLAQVLTMRLNPEVLQTPRAALLGFPLWATWGALGAGLPLLAVLAVIGRLRRRGFDWPAPQLTALVYLLVAVMSKINADLHPEFLSGTGHRILRQDAVAWLVGALLAVGLGAAVRRAGAGTRLRIAFSVVMLLLPLVRLIWQPTPPSRPLEIAVRPLGEPQRPLLVVGLGGLESRLLLAEASQARNPTLLQIQSDGSWGPTRPNRPFLYRSVWTSLAVGTIPAHHGVKSRWAWELPWLRGQPLRLLPWTPQGSRMILPWGVADRVTPPPASVPPLWERLRASGVETAVFGWPGIWAEDVRLEQSAEELSTLDPDLRTSLELALEPFAAERQELWRTLAADQGRVDGARAALAGGARNVWLRLHSLSLARQRLDPLRIRHTREREIIDLVIETVDGQLGSLLAAADPETTVAVVSPYGLAPPDSLERLKRLVGIGDDWRSSPESCPEGVLLLAGRGVTAGRRFDGIQMTDLAPTLCYLLGLPVAQYMDGEVIVDAVEEDYLARHPLQVVD